MLFFGIVPCLTKGKISIIGVESTFADDYGGENTDTTPTPDYNGLYSSLSELYGLDITGSHINSNGQTVFDLANGSLFNPNFGNLSEVQINGVKDQIIGDNPLFFPPGSYEANPDNYADIKDLLDYITELTSQNNSNTTNNVTDPCLKARVDAALNGNLNNRFSNMLKTTFGTNSDLNINFYQYSNANDTSTDATTDRTNNNWDIGFNYAALQYASQEEMMATIYHEILHAYLSSRGINGETNQHNAMANDWLSIIANQLKSDFPNLSQEDANDLAWGGLGDTTKWQELKNNDSLNNTHNADNILQTNKNYKNLNNTDNRYGTHCN